MCTRPAPIFVGLALIITSGCGGTSGTPTGEKAPESTAAQSRTGATTPEAGSKTEMAHAAPANPALMVSNTTPGAVDAVRQTLRAVQSGKLEIAYDFLPESYQRDIDELIRQFAQQMDPDIWAAAFAVAQKGVEVLRQKESEILELMEEESGMFAASDLRRDWDQFADALDLLVSSELADVEQLGKVRARDFLGSTGNQVFAKLRTVGGEGRPNPIDQLAEVQVELLAENVDSATLRIQAPNAPDAEATRFVRVQGRWIPENLASTWEGTMQLARRRLEQLSPETLAVRKDEILSGLRAIDGALDQMLAAQTAEELNQAAFPLMLQGIQLQSMLSAPAGPTNGVTIIVTGELSDDAQTKLLSDLEQLTDNPERATYTASASGGQTTIALRPVRDAAAFAEKLTFAKSKSVDLGSRTIRVVLDEN